MRCGVEFLFHIPCVTDQSISSDSCSLRPRSVGRDGKGNESGSSECGRKTKGRIDEEESKTEDEERREESQEKPGWVDTARFQSLQ